MSEHQGQHDRAIDRIRALREERQQPEKLFERLLRGDRDALSMAITEVERNSSEARERSAVLLELALPYSGKAKRIGITGVPGVGKSTFIETFGTLLTSRGQRLAVLAIDPSSSRSGGSILGDKTRMEQLSRNPNAYIRPSAAADTLGGVARATRESIMLCEAAGFDTIIVETVGVGQSETTVHGMVDFFLLLMLAGAGDELQGIKRGIMEMADAISITKADGDNMRNAEMARKQYQNALHLFPPSEKNWEPPVTLSSALEDRGMEKLEELIDHYFQKMSESSWLAKHREEQDLLWLHEALNQELLSAMKSDTTMRKALEEAESAVVSRRSSPFAAARSLIRHWLE